MNTIRLNTIGILSGGGNAGGGGNSGGGGTAVVTANDVNFQDYDGTILHSYTKSQFLGLSELPELPSRSGLTCQGWNWTLNDAKAYVQEYGAIDIGATYITEDGKTRLYITIAEEGRMEFSIRLMTVENGVSVDWGDGSPAETIGISTGTFTFFKHTYSSKGDYIVTIDVLEGTMSFYGTSQYNTFGNKVYGNMIKKLEIGNGVTSIGEYAFNSCYSLSSVVIPYGVTTIDNYSFQHCYSLSSVVIPNSATTIATYTFGNCYSLSSVVIPNSVTNIAAYAFQNCYSLSSVVIPDSVTIISTYSFNSCSSLSSVVIPNSVTTIATYAFRNCYSLSSVVIPYGVTTIDKYVFQSCSSLSSVVIPNSVTIIATYAFQNCYSLSSVVIPNSVTSINSYAFGNCAGIAIYDFSHTLTVPALTNANAFSSLASDCKFVVPDALYDEWIGATNWSTYANQIVKASEFNG